MQAPPAVAYPVGRPWQLAFAVTSVGAAGLALCLAAAWTDRSEAGLLRGGLMALGIVALVVHAWVAWRRLLHGRLHWDGQVWRLDPPADRDALPALPLERIDVVELPFALLIRVRVTPATMDPPAVDVRWGRTRWIWAAQRDAPGRWHALRCAALAGGWPASVRPGRAELST
jgi:hypothetical protein